MFLQQAGKECAVGMRCFLPTICNNFCLIGQHWSIARIQIFSQILNANIHNSNSQKDISDRPCVTIRVAMAHVLGDLGAIHVRASHCSPLSDVM